MRNANNELQDVLITHQHQIENYKNSLQKKVKAIYVAGLRALRTQLLAYADSHSNQISSKALSVEITKALKKIQLETDKTFIDTLAKEMRNFSEAEKDFYNETMQSLFKSVDLKLPLVVPKKGELYTQSRKQKMYLGANEITTYPAQEMDQKNRSNLYLNNLITRGYDLNTPIFDIAEEAFTADTGSYKSIANNALIMTTLVAQHVSATSRDGFFNANKKLVRGYKWVSILDNKTSDICRYLSEKVWYYDDSEESTLPGPIEPPAHRNCFHKNTRVYTDKGFKYFYELDGTEKCWAFNPDKPDEQSFIPIREKIIEDFDGELIHFKSNDFSMAVTPKHNMVVTYAKSDGSGKYHFVEADKLPKWSNTIYRTAKIKGIKRTFTNLGDYKIPTELYCIFMGYYLSKGSVSFYNDKKRYEVKIAHKKHLDKFWEDLKGLPFKLYKCKEGIITHDYSVGVYLKQFGKSFKKFVPSNIKELDSQYINLFLDAYILGDGNVLSERLWKGYMFRKHMRIYTSSDRMKDDLMELLLKAGQRPSVALASPKGTVTKFKNGTCNSNHDVYKITMCRRSSTMVETLKRNKLVYKDKVYCVELEKWHTLLVEYEGRVAWSGNCRSITVPIVKESEELPIPEAITSSALMMGFLNGKPADETTYYQWLERQPDEIQKEVLGPVRYAMWKNKNIKIDKFHKEDGRYYTLAELQQRGLKIPNKYLSYVRSNN